MIVFIILTLIFMIVCFTYSNPSLEGWTNFKKKKWCMNCNPIAVKKKDTQYFTSNTKDVPLWLKQESNYSFHPKALLTNNKFNVFKNQKLTEFTSCQNNCLIFSFDLHKIPDIPSKENLWIYYWATKKRNYKDFVLPQPKEAFGEYENSGLRQSDKNGIIRFKLRNPQPYQYNGEMYPPHLHFCYKLNENIWSEQIYTIFFFPILNLKKFKQIKDNHLAILVNALPKDKGDMEGTVKCPYDEMKKINIKSTIKNELKRHEYKKINRLIENKRITYKQVPIVIFCKNKECYASTQLFNYFLYKGYYNLMKFPGGIEEWESSL